MPCVCWAELTGPLLEAILSHLQQQGASFKDLLAVTHVCQHWRDVGSSLWFSGSCWQGTGQAGIRHPRQLLTLCPVEHAPGGLLRGEVRRDTRAGWSLSGRLQRYTFHQGLPPVGGPEGQADVLPTGKFLLAAEQRGSLQGGFAIYQTRSCTGKPIAYLQHNALRTAYTLVAGSSSQLLSSSVSRTPSGSSHSLSTLSSSSSSSTRRDLHSCSCSSSSSIDATGDEPTTAPAPAAVACPAVLLRLKYKQHLAALAPRRLSVTSTVMKAQNKRPLFNTQLRTWYLNFGGRVKHASAKNLQLVSAAQPHPESICLQFGKVEADRFALDFDPCVVTALQALAVALSTF